MTGRFGQHDQPSLRSPPSHINLHSGRNVFLLLARREISPKTKYIPRRRWGATSKRQPGLSSWENSESVRESGHGLISWVEAESLRNLSAKYCPLVPPPRSTIAAAFSPDGKTLASTHGDHTVKIIDLQTGKCLKVLSGHRRTPWVVRFHPFHSNILASGSLDHEVRIWNANTSECIGSRDFYRPIASIAFHAEGEILAVASGHKLYIWHYNKKGEGSSPTIVLKTRRSLRAVHFHPHDAPFLLTAEVTDLDSSDSSMTQATSSGYLRYPPPTILVKNAQPSERNQSPSELPIASIPFSFMPVIYIDESGTEHHVNRPIGSSDIESGLPPNAYLTALHSGTVSLFEPSGSYSGTVVDVMDIDTSQPVAVSQIPRLTNLNTGGQISSQSDSSEFGQVQHYPSSWELPFLQGWLMGQSQAGVTSIFPLTGSFEEHLAHSVGPSVSHPSSTNLEAGLASLTIPGFMNLSGVSGRSGSQDHMSRSHILVSGSGEGDASNSYPHDGTNTQPIVSRIQYELATTLAAATAAAELPCSVKLRVWSHDIKNPCGMLNTEKLRLTIPHAVLCSEMGAHFSPCGRFLAACIACVLPNAEADPGLQSLVHQDPGEATSPTRHPVSAHQIMYELRIYSLEEATFGLVLISRAVRAAHCLTSIQFSPTSEHVLLAYGRRHGSLLKSIVIDGETTSPVYTVLEVYRVSDLELVRVLPSAEDEVNVACFHPSAGGGLTYGTKEGKLRVLQYDSAQCSSFVEPTYVPRESLAEVQSYALEC